MNQVLNARLRGREFWVGQVKKLMRKRVVNTIFEIISNLQTRCKNNKKKLRYLYPSSPFLILCHIYLCLYTHTHTHTNTHMQICVHLFIFLIHVKIGFVHRLFLMHLYYHVYMYIS